jgi:ACS family hexuronate transporter-like MFS transporter
MPIFVIFYILFTQYYTSNNTQTPTFASKYKSIIMSTFQNTAGRMTNYRWIICAMLFFATTVNYLDRQVLSLTWKDFISPEFHWTDTHYGYITAIFSIVYALGNLFAGRFIDWMGTKKGYLWAIAVWSIGACMHALCGLATEMTLGIENAANMISATGALASTIAITSVYYFIAARIILGIGEAGNFPAAIKVTAEYFPKKDRAFSTSIFNAGSTIGALIAPLCIPTLARYFQRMGVGNGWEMAFIVICVCHTATHTACTVSVTACMIFLFIFIDHSGTDNIQPHCNHQYNGSAYNSHPNLHFCFLLKSYKHPYHSDRKCYNPCNHTLHDYD